MIATDGTDWHQMAQIGTKWHRLAGLAESWADDGVWLNVGVNLVNFAGCLRLKSGNLTPGSLTSV
jgi:hypothetical protein